MDYIIIRGENEVVYQLDLAGIPFLSRIYRVIRRTVWQIAEDDNILIFVTEGKCEIESDGKRDVVSAGEIYFVPQGHSYKRSPVDKTLCTMFYAHFGFCGELREVSEKDACEKAEKNDGEEQDLRDKNNRQEHFSVFLSRHIYIGEKLSVLVGLFDSAHTAINENDVGGRLFADSMLCGILAKCSDLTMKNLLQNHDVRLPENLPERLKSAVLYIRRNVGEKITLASLCRHLAVSKQQLIRCFHDGFDTTPTAYIMSYKVDKAKEMFANSPQITVKEVSAALGFDDQCYFSRLFTHVSGESPTEYKKRIATFDERKHIRESMGEKGSQSKN